MVNYQTIRRSVTTNLAIGGVSVYKVKKLLDHKSVDITEHYLNLSHLDYKEDLTVFQNHLFKGFSTLRDKDFNEDSLDSKKIENNDIKDKLIKSILVISRNICNEILRISLQTLNEDELKYKLTTYV